MRVRPYIMDKGSLFEYSQREEWVNVITHGLGAFLSFAGTIYLLFFAHMNGGMVHFISYGLFGFSLFSLYLASTLYHLSRDEKTRILFKKLDHICIYFLIAGSYTPFLLINVKGSWGAGMMAGIWGLAIFGTILKLILKRKFTLLSVSLYLAMGWMIVVGRGPILNSIPPEGVKWLFIGGIFYTVGVPFYLMKKIEYHHALWHLFVLGGSVSHFVAVLKSFVP
jgi:hemolysin III